MTARRSKTSTKTLPCGRPSPSRGGESARGEGTELLETLLRTLNDYCEGKALNRTAAREKILRTMVDGPRHFTALELHDRLRARFSEVGKATLYRNLPIFVESGVIQEGPTDAQGQTHFEIVDSHHHDHIVCTDCGQIFEFHDEVIEKRQELAARDLSFSPTGHRHVIYARCEYLKRTSGRGKRESSVKTSS